MLHSHALEWIDHYAGRGANDVINDRTRREYRRLLITYALSYFDPEVRLRDIDEQHTHAFVEWLCRHPGPDGRRLSDRSIHNAVQPLRACLRHAVASRRLDRAPGTLVMPRRRRGVPYVFDERRFLTRDQLADLLCEIPDAWRPLFELLVSTGLRISEAIALRVIDARVELEPPRVHVPHSRARVWAEAGALEREALSSGVPWVAAGRAPCFWRRAGRNGFCAWDLLPSSRVFAAGAG